MKSSRIALFGLLALILVISLGSVVSAINISESLVYYTFDNPDVIITNPQDVTGNGRHGTNTLCDANVVGQINEGFRCTGAGWISLASPGMWGTGGAVSIWFNRSAGLDEFNYLVSQSSGSSPQWYTGMGNGANDGKLVFYEHFGTGHYDYTNGVYDDGQFHHVVFNKNGTAMTIWVDGNPDANITVASTFTLTRIVEIGSRAGGTQGNWKGRIDGFWMVNRTLSDMEISDLFTEGLQYPFTPSGYDLLLYRTNNTGVNKSIFDEGEDFRMSALFNYDNGTNITDANCTFTLDEGIIETDATVENFTLCGTGCDYSLYNEGLTGLKSTNKASGTDDMHFYACHEQLPQGDMTASFRCGTRSYTEVIPAESVPECSDGRALILLRNDSCVNESSVNLSVAYSGINNRRKEITGLALDRTFNTLNVNGTYNSTTKRYEAPDKFEYYDHGSYMSSVSCDIDGVTEMLEKPITVVNAPPSILFNRVFNEGGISQVLNGSDVQFYAGTWNFSIAILDDDLYNFEINISNTTTVVASFTSFPVTLESGVFDEFDANPYNITVWANDTAGDITNATLSFNVTDTINPVCTGLLSTTVLNATTYDWNIRCTDENFFSFNFSCTNGITRYVDGLNIQIYNYTNSSLMTATTNCTYEYCDGHTAQTLTADYYVRTYPRKIEVEVDGVEHRLEIMNVNATFNWTRLDDRIEFILIPYESVVLSSLKELEFYYTVSPRAYYFPSDEYTAWIVDPVTRTWFDLNSETLLFKKVSVERWNSTSFRIVALIDDKIKPGDLDKIKFKSLGELNCVSGSQKVTVVSLTDNFGWGIFKGSCPLEESVAYVIGFIALVVFLIWLVYWNKATLDYPFINIFVGLAFFGVGVAIFRCSNFMSIPVFFFGILLWLQEITGINTRR